MELNKVELLIEKYFQGETSIAEEKELKSYFSSLSVAQHLEQYRSLFVYFTHESELKFTPEVPLQSKKRNLAWMKIAVSVAVLLCGGTYVYFDNKVVKEDLGTYDNPEVALKETQKALAMISNHVNRGIESVIYVQEYEKSKKIIFKQ